MEYKYPPRSPTSPALPLVAPRWPDDEVVDALAMWLREGHPACAEMWQALGKTWPTEHAWKAAPADGRLWQSVAQQMAKRDHDEAEHLCKLASRVTNAGPLATTLMPPGNWRLWHWTAQSANTFNPWLAWLRQHVRSLP